MYSIQNINELTSNVVCIVFEGQDIKYSVPYKWLAETMPVLTCMLAWQRIDKRKTILPESKVLYLSEDMYFGRMTADLIEHLIEYACSLHFQRSPFRDFDFDHFPWAKLSTAVGLADYLGAISYAKDLYWWLYSLDLDCIKETHCKFIEWYTQLMQTYHNFVHDFPEDHNSIQELRVSIAKEIEIQSSTDVCTCSKKSEYGLDTLTFRPTTLTDYWDEMNGCKLTSIFRDSKWSLSTATALVIDCSYPNVPRFTYRYGDGFLVLLHYWLAKHKGHHKAAMFTECVLVCRKSDLLRRREILDSLFRYTSTTDEQIQCAIKLFNTHHDTIDKRYEDMRRKQVLSCHNCLRSDKLYRYERCDMFDCDLCDSYDADEDIDKQCRFCTWTADFKYRWLYCNMCNKLVCNLCHAQCSRCEKIRCYVCCKFQTIVDWPERESVCYDCITEESEPFYMICYDGDQDFVYYESNG